MFLSDAKTVAARKRHLCTWCGQDIERGEQHKTWTSFEGGWFRSRMHAECCVAMEDDNRETGEQEYIPYDNARPKVEATPQLSEDGGARGHSGTESTKLEGAGA